MRLIYAEQLEKLFGEQRERGSTGLFEAFEDALQDTPTVDPEGLREMNMLNKLADEIYENSCAHGWHDREREFPEIVALCHSELSEALEEYRSGRGMLYIEGGKPEGVAVEMADCIIRILDWAAHEGVDMDVIIRAKHEYNKTRSYRHGGKLV